MPPPVRGQSARSSAWGSGASSRACSSASRRFRQPAQPASSRAACAAAPAAASRWPRASSLHPRCVQRSRPPAAVRRSIGIGELRPQHLGGHLVLVRGSCSSNASRDRARLRPIVRAAELTDAFGPVPERALPARRRDRARAAARPGPIRRPRSGRPIGSAGPARRMKSRPSSTAPLAAAAASPNDSIQCSWSSRFTQLFRGQPGFHHRRRHRPVVLEVELEPAGLDPLGLLVRDGAASTPASRASVSSTSPMSPSPKPRSTRRTWWTTDDIESNPARSAASPEPTQHRPAVGGVDGTPSKRLFRPRADQHPQAERLGFGDGVLQIGHGGGVEQQQRAPPLDECLGPNVVVRRSRWPRRWRDRPTERRRRTRCATCASGQARRGCAPGRAVRAARRATPRGDQLGEGEIVLRTIVVQAGDPANRRRPPTQRTRRSGHDEQPFGGRERLVVQPDQPGRLDGHLEQHLIVGLLGERVGRQSKGEVGGPPIAELDDGTCASVLDHLVVTAGSSGVPGQLGRVGFGTAPSGERAPDRGVDVVRGRADAVRPRPVRVRVGT